MVVGVAAIHAIDLVVAPTPASPVHPVRPGTRAWGALLESAGVKPELHRLTAALMAQQRAQAPVA
jgi:hypothetical protein